MLTMLKGETVGDVYKDSLGELHGRAELDF